MTQSADHADLALLLNRPHSTTTKATPLHRQKPIEVRKPRRKGAVRLSASRRHHRVAGLMGKGSLSLLLAGVFSLLLSAVSLAAPKVEMALYQPMPFDAYGADITAPLVMAQVPEHPPAVEAISVAQEAGPVKEAAPTNFFGLNEIINLIAIMAVVWIALRTERLRKQADDTGRFRRLHDRMDDHSRRLAAHETRLQGLPTHKDLARIDARLIAVEQTMQQIAHSVTRMEDFLINGISAAQNINHSGQEVPNDA